MEQVTVEYVPEKPELDDGVDDEFRKIFEKFSFQDIAGFEVSGRTLVDCWHCLVVFPCLVCHL